MATPRDTGVLILAKEKERYLVQGVPSGEEYYLPRRLKLTKEAVDRLPVQPFGQRIHWDSEMPCFGIVIGKEAKSYIVQKDVNGKPIRVTIGRHGIWAPDEARKEARKRLVEMDKGVDPVEQERLAKRAMKARSITLRIAYDDYKSSRNLKPNTILDYDHIVKRVFDDWMGTPLMDITKEMVDARHKQTKERSGHPYADYAMRILSAVISDASIRYEGPNGGALVSDNPCRILKKAWAKPVRRDTKISDDDLPQWFKTLDGLRYDKERPELAVGCDYLELVVFTGLRRNEAATLQWDQIDFAKKTLTVRETKNGEVHVLPITDPIVSLLERRKAEAAESPWVFPSPGRKNPDGHLMEPRYVGDLVTAACGVKFTIHDLRRTFATAGAGRKIGYYDLKRLLNHKMNGDVTAGYIIDDVEDLREPMQRITDYFMALKARAQGMKLAGAS